MLTAAEPPHHLDRRLGASHGLQHGACLFVAPRGVHDDEVPLLLLELVHTLLRDGRGVRLAVAAEEGDAGFGGVLLQLVEGTCRPPGAEYCKEVCIKSYCSSWCVSCQKKGMPVLVAFCFS